MASTLSPGLYVTATPIGNLGDMTQRARDVLAGVDVIACEDTRVTGRLIGHFGLATKLTPYHDHNAAQVRPKLVGQLEEGARIALVSDAGTPLVSDPGYKLVRAARARGVAVFSVPGPSALTAAIAVAGLPSDRVLFAGFLPSRAGARRTALREVAAIAATLVFFERGSRLAASLADMAALLGPREATICRELTKLHEETRHGGLATLAETPFETRGEFVVVVGPPAAAETGDADIDRLLREALVAESPSRAAALVAAATGVPRRRVYQRALALVRS